jgi:hypothetical protein
LILGPIAQLNKESGVPNRFSNFRIRSIYTISWFGRITPALNIFFNWASSSPANPNGVRPILCLTGNNREVEDDPPDSSSPEGGPENGKREIPEHLINLFDKSSWFGRITPALNIFFNWASSSPANPNGVRLILCLTGRLVPKI